MGYKLQLITSSNFIYRGRQQPPIPPNSKLINLI
jgi:hypothetical protein